MRSRWHARSPSLVLVEQEAGSGREVGSDFVCPQRAKSGSRGASMRANPALDSGVGSGKNPGEIGCARGRAQEFRR